MIKRTGLFFGTFNPVHVGHLILANHLVQYTYLDEIWFVVTPHNPHKKKSSLLDDNFRYEMVWNLCEEFPNLKPSNIEFNLPQPNYTINTLTHLKEKFPEKEFSLIMGEDNLKNFDKWKNYGEILKQYQLVVYPRYSGGEIKSEFENHPKISFTDAPRIEISSTFIRQAIKKGKDVRPMLPEKVWEYIDRMGFYKD